MLTRICETLADKGKLVHNSEIYKLLGDNINKKDFYTSIFYYTEKHKKDFDTTGTIAGITDVVTNKLFFDFDCESAPETARKDCQALVQRLLQAGYAEGNVEVYFSGYKGFSVVVPLTESLTPPEVKNICLNVGKDLSTLDTKIYNASRVFRLPLTRHPKTGLYKIPLSHSFLSESSMDAIKEAAKANMKPEDIDGAWVASPLTKAYKELKNKAIEAPKIDTINSTLVFDVKDVDWTTRPKFLSPEKYLLSLGFFDEGQRSHSLMILASTLKNAGFNQTQCYHFLKAAAEQQAERSGDDKFPKKEIYNNIIAQVFGPNWKGGVYSVKDDDVLRTLSVLVPESVKRTADTKDVLSANEAFDAFIDYANDIDKNTIKTGIKSLDAKLHMQVGRLYAVLAAPGVGKTSIVLEIMNMLSKSGEHCQFFSYDMSKFDVVQKLLQKHLRIPTNVLYKAFKDKDVDKLQHYRQALINNYKNVSFVYKTGQSIEDIKSTIIETEKTLGINTRLVVVDYLELVQSKFSDPTQASMEAIQGLREVAINLNKAVVVLLQPSKMGTSVDEPVTSYTAAKGSAAVAQAVTAMLTLHRPGYSSRNPEHDNYLSIDCVKNRSGGLFSVDLHWEGLTGNIRELESIEAQQLSELREFKKQEKSKKNMGDF